MAEMLSKKKFTNHADSAMVARKYDEFFHLVSSSAEELKFSGFADIDDPEGDAAVTLGWGPVDARHLAEVLPKFQCCRTIKLSHHPLEDEGVAHIVENLVALPLL